MKSNRFVSEPGRMASRLGFGEVVAKDVIDSGQILSSYYDTTGQTLLHKAWQAGKAADKTKTDRAFVDECVKVFLACGQNIAMQSREVWSEEDEAKRIQAARRAWAALQKARLFMFRPERWFTFYQHSGRFVCESGGVDWAKGMKPETVITDEDMEKLRQAYQEGAHLPYPEQLPFDAVFFCYGSECLLSSSALTSRIPPEISNLGDCFLLGNLLWQEGESSFAGTFFLCDKLPSPDIGFHLIHEDGLWLYPESFDPWILTSLVRQVNEHRKSVV